MTATYTLPRMVANTSSSHPGVSTGVVHAGGAEEGTVYHNYYQWVCLLLAVQASICYLPWAVWKGIEGGRVGKLLAKVSQDPLTETPLSEQVGDFIERCHFMFCIIVFRLQVLVISCIPIVAGSTLVLSSFYSVK